MIVQDRLRDVGPVVVEVMVFVVAVIFPQRQLNIDWMRWWCGRYGSNRSLCRSLSLSWYVSITSNELQSNSSFESVIWNMQNVHRKD